MAQSKVKVNTGYRTRTFKVESQIGFSPTLTIWVDGEIEWSKTWGLREQFMDWSKDLRGGWVIHTFRVDGVRCELKTTDSFVKRLELYVDDKRVIQL